MFRDLITGANKGFIGGHLARSLKDKKNNLRLLRQDEWRELEDVIENFSPDRIFHLASYGNHYHQRNFKKTLDVNVVKTFRLLEASRNLNYKTFVLLGSSSEYGIKNAPMKETDLLEPDTFYGATKASATLLSQIWAKNFDKPIVIVRPFSIFGPGEAEHRFIPTIIRSCLLGESMELDPDAVHDWLFVPDLIDGILLAAKKAGDLKGQVLNLGSGVQTTNRKIVEIVEEICDKKANILESRKTRSYDNATWVADITRAKSFGWKIKFSLTEGLVETVEYYAKTITRAKS